MKKKVLVVEDEVIIAENHKDNLLSFGIDEVRIAHSYGEAMLCLENFTPDLILLDLRLKDKFEGLDFGRMIKSQFDYPIIYVTAHSDETTIKSILETNPSAFLNKPVRKSELFSAVMIALNNHQKTDSKSIICLEEAGTKIRFDKNELVLVKSQGNYVQLLFDNMKKQLIRMTMEGLLAELNHMNFCRVNRSYIVNIQYVDSVKNKNIFIQDQKLSVSPNMFSEFLMRFENSPVD